MSTAALSAGWERHLSNPVGPLLPGSSPDEAVPLEFPDTVLGIFVDLLIDGTWTGLVPSPVPQVYARDGIRITRGRANESAQVDRSVCSLTLNNRDGKYSPRNPLSPLYGLIGRNTLFRTGVHVGPTRGVIPDPDFDYFQCSDHARLDVTGDLDVRADIDMDSWSSNATLINKFDAAVNQCSYLFWIGSDGIPLLTWSPDGTSGSALTSEATERVPWPCHGRKTIRATLDVNNGAAGHTVTFYTGDSVDGPWTQLGDPVVTSGTTSIYAGTAAMLLTTFYAIGESVRGRYYAAKVLSGIGGTEVANPDLTVLSDGQTAFTDSAGNNWVCIDDAAVTDRHVRMSGEVSEWPQRWDSSGTDVFVPIQASGILRRLGQGSSPLKSTLYRGVTGLDNVVAYWPCEDGSDATQIASALTGGRPMTLTGVAATLASNEEFKCSSPLPVMAAGGFSGIVPSYVTSGDVQTRFLLKVPSAGSTNGAPIMSGYMSGTIRKWSLFYGTAGTGTLTLTMYDAAGDQVASTGAIAFGVEGTLLRVTVGFSTNGADVDYEVATLEVGEVSGSVTSGTATTETIGRTTRIDVTPNSNMSDIVVGHVSVENDFTSIFDVYQELNAYIGDTAGDRIRRLCSEEGISFVNIGGVEDTAAMGAQTPKTLLELLTECADADHGILFEPRDLFGIGYRTRESLIAQTAKLALDYTSDLVGIEPVDDDQFVRNDVTVTRGEGSSARAVQETGPLSTAPPPDGVGKYDESRTLNLETDTALEDHASWLLHLGTVDESRYPVISIDMTRTAFAEDQELVLAAMSVDVGDRITVDNPPAWLPPEDITQIAQGFTESLANYEHTITMVCSPESPYHVAVYDDGAARYSLPGSTLTSNVAAADTSLSVTLAGGGLWGHGDGDFDVMIGGERVTVTGVSGAASPQTFTVTRAVNGISKPHLAGSEITLADPVYRTI